MECATLPGISNVQRVPRRIVLIGPPGVGKGTQAELLSTTMGAAHISTGDLVRAAIRSGSSLGQVFQRYNDQGELVPDQVMMDLVLPYVTGSPAWILDGFPRDVPQARSLDSALATLGLHVDRAIALRLPDDMLIERLQNRRLSVATSVTYNLRFDPPPPDDPGPFVQRADDRPAEIKRRLEIYHAATEPLLAYYARRGDLLLVEADGSIEAVHEKLVAALAPTAV